MRKYLIVTSRWEVFADREHGRTEIEAVVGPPKSRVSLNQARLASHAWPRFDTLMHAKLWSPTEQLIGEEYRAIYQTHAIWLTPHSLKMPLPQFINRSLLGHGRSPRPGFVLCERNSVRGGAFGRHKLRCPAMG
jgi:hypothetical protein